VTDDEDFESISAPYRYEGPEIEEITVTGKPSTIPLAVYLHRKPSSTSSMNL
jgi:hypothetical protein